MTNLDKAHMLYMRGFGGQYIKRSTGISVQSMLKQLLMKDVKIAKSDIVAYQVKYIRERYSVDEIEQAYKSLISENKNPYELRRGKHLRYLGCGFGDYPKVFRELLGKERYEELKASCWKMKQVESVRATYGADNVFDKRVFHTVASDEAIAKGRVARQQKLIKRYGVMHPNQNPDVAAKMVASSKVTFMDKYGVDNPMKVPAIAKRSATNRQAVMLARYGAGNSVQIKAIREKIFDARLRNGTCSSSRPEDMLYEILKSQFGDVRRNVVVDKRYPWHVDFYIPERDLFIELNGDPSHGGHFFDADSKADQQRCLAWQINSVEKLRYGRMLKVWTQTDVAKRDAARQADLNYLVFWDAAMVHVNGKQVPRLLDVYAWIADGCPDSEDWHKENTY